MPLKKVLIISPYFPPSNAADMQRVRMSLSYFKEFGWEPFIVTVDPVYSDIAKDPLLEQSVPQDVPIIYVKALSKKWTSKFGLGSIALRSLWFYRRKVNQLLASEKFDLIYFSTTQSVVCTLGTYWKRRFGIPFVIDMQDPWFSDYYKNKPKDQQPPKYWFSYRLAKHTEPIAMRKVDGLISVTDAYIETLAKRYPNCKNIPGRTITFGAFIKDLDIAINNRASQPPRVCREEGKTNIVYVGRGGYDMQEAVGALFRAFKACLDESPDLFRNFHFYFFGTSYAASGTGKQYMKPVALEQDVAEYVTEHPDRIPFYQSLNTLAEADGLFIPGSNDPQYTASKIYPYVMVKKPLLAYFHPASSVVSFLRNSGAGIVVTFDQPAAQIQEVIKAYLYTMAKKQCLRMDVNSAVLDAYSARTMTQKQCELFNEVIA